MPPRRTRPAGPAPSLTAPLPPPSPPAATPPTGPHFSQYSPVDITDVSADLRVWQEHWEQHLKQTYYVPPGRVRRRVERIAVPDALDPETAAERADRVLRIRQRCNIIREALDSYEGAPKGSHGQVYRPVDVWTTKVGPEHREAIILAAIAHASLFGDESGEGEWTRELVPELVLGDLTRDQGRRCWGIIRALTSPLAEGELYPRIRNETFDEMFAEGRSRGDIPASRAVRATQAIYIEIRHAFLARFAAYVVVGFIHWDSNKDGTPDYARYRKHFVDVSNQIGGGSASDPSKPFLHGCSKCQKLEVPGEPKHKICMKCREAGLDPIMYCSPECQKADWKMHKPGCGKPYVDTIAIPSFIETVSILPPRTPLGVRQQVAQHEQAGPLCLWTFAGHPLMIPDWVSEAFIEEAISLRDAVVQSAHLLSSPPPTSPTPNNALNPFEESSAILVDFHMFIINNFALLGGKEDSKMKGDPGVTSSVMLDEHLDDFEIGMEQVRTGVEGRVRGTDRRWGGEWWIKMLEEMELAAVG